MVGAVFFEKDRYNTFLFVDINVFAKEEIKDRSQMASEPNESVLSADNGLSSPVAKDDSSLSNGGQQMMPVTFSTPTGSTSASEQTSLDSQVKDMHIDNGDDSVDWHFPEPSAEPNGDTDKGSEFTENDPEQQELLALWSLLQHRLGLNFPDMTDEPREQILEELTLDGIATHIKAGKCKNIIVMTGAGISTSAGIPDFRSPGSGLYANLQKYNLPSPESVFDIMYFKENPGPFYMLAKELYPGNYKPTISHYFESLLAKKGLLRRTYTQNIDGLERGAGIDDSLIVQAHGTFHTSHCLDCKEEYTENWVKDEIFNDNIPRCKKCNGLVKPDIVFFGESLPLRFFEAMPMDFKECDLLIVMGTSLVVQPFASLIDRVPKDAPRLLINKEKCGVGVFSFFGGFNFDGENKYRDVAWLGSCDDGCLELADKLGWKEELLAQAAQDGVFPMERCSDNIKQDEDVAGASARDSSTDFSNDHFPALGNLQDKPISSPDTVGEEENKLTETYASL